MNVENAVRGAIWFFVLIVVGSLLSALLGGLFGALVALISPQFVESLFILDGSEPLLRYAFAAGMIWGLFIGAGVSGFACFMAGVIKIVKMRRERSEDPAPGERFTDGDAK